MVDIRRSGSPLIKTRSFLLILNQMSDTRQIKDPKTKKIPMSFSLPLSPTSSQSPKRQRHQDHSFLKKNIQKFKILLFGDLKNIVIRNE